MGLFSTLFGRKKLPPSTSERLGAIASAELTIRTALEAEPTGEVGLAIRPLAASEFARVRGDVEQMLQIAGRDLGSTTELVPDEFGFLWVVVRDEDFPDLVAALQTAAQMISEEGYRDRMLCAVFPFRDARAEPLHLVYTFKRGSFYAFAPRLRQQRDLGLELRVHSVLEAELPLEKDLEYRYPLWGIPLGTRGPEGLGP